jgi:hypothetical protein
MQWSREKPKKGDFVMYIKEIVPNNLHERRYGICTADKLSGLNDYVRIYISTGEHINVKINEVIVII